MEVYCPNDGKRLPVRLDSGDSAIVWCQKCRQEYRVIQDRGFMTYAAMEPSPAESVTFSLTTSRP